MSWRDQYQQGSFRGAAFRTEYHERSGGRRVAVHEFPARDEPVVEDLGRRARQFAFDCHTIGAGYAAARDALIEALEGHGPGLLVHPWHGSMMVAVLDYSSSESTEEGGLCRFRVTFVEAGQPVSSPVAVAAGNAAALEADTLLALAPADFAARFSIDGAASFVEDAASDLVGGMAAIAQTAAGLRGGVGPTLRAFEAGLRLLPDNLSGLLRAPIQLGQALGGLVQAVSALGLGGGRSQRLAPLEMMLDWQPTLPVFPARTPQRRREADNRTALLHMFRTAAAAELVRAAAALSYASHDEAVATRDRVAARLDTLALAAADRLDEASAAVFDRLRLALVRDIAARGPTLARLYRLRLAVTEPSLVVAHRLYGHVGARQARLEDLATGMVARNRVIHPGFMPAQADLDLLTVAAAA